MWLLCGVVLWCYNGAYALVCSAKTTYITLAVTVAVQGNVTILDTLLYAKGLTTLWGTPNVLAEFIYVEVRWLLSPLCKVTTSDPFTHAFLYHSVA